jgi:hypothetical protein
MASAMKFWSEETEMFLESDSDTLRVKERYRTTTVTYSAIRVLIIGKTTTTSHATVKDVTRRME